MTSFLSSMVRMSLIIGIAFVTIPSQSSFADALGSLESYSHWVDVVNQPSAGSWTKVDSPNPVVNQGELVVAPQHGTAYPRTGDSLLDLRTEAIYTSGGDGANYNYGINSDDFGGINPASVGSGVVDLEFWICPNTWSGDANRFTSEGIYQETSLLNTSGDTLASVGMYSLGNSNSPEVHYSVDGVNWLSTGLIADSSTWTKVSMSIDLDAQASTIGFTDVSSNSFESIDMDWSGSITDASVTTLNFKMVDGVTKNYFDDFSFNVTAAAVPEPCSAVLAVLGAGGLAIRRRRTL